MNQTHLTETARRWTPEQQDAIEARNGTLLVSAAAGSGKTAVLIQRVLERLTDREHPCGADRLLIVTFTKAATSEMRSRLSSALQALLAEHPDDSNLQEQQMLLPSASICTIDAFCSKLVREHFDEAGVSPDFRMLDEEELEILERTAVSSVIEELYAEDDPAFRSLVELLYAGRDDISLEDNIISLYNFSRVYPSPRAWLEQAVSDYEPGVDRRRSPIIKVLIDNTLEMTDGLSERVRQAQEAVLSSEQLAGAKGLDALDDDINLCRTVREAVQNAAFDEARDAAGNHSFLTWGTPRGTKDVPEAILGKQAHAAVKDGMKKIPSILCTSLEEAETECAAAKPIAEKLLEAVFRFETELNRLKAERNALDFSDVELAALSLLVCDPAAENPERTLLAKTIGDQFEEILIDEYQDTNRAQDMIFTALSRQGSNLFMVGDVKQSIYRFRQAMPEIFLQKKDSYIPYTRQDDAYPAAVTLGKNFRSREGITQAVNFTFSQLMSRRLGDIAYDASEELVYGAAYPPSDRPDVEFHILEPDADTDKTKNEAAHIARFILAEMQERAASDQPLHYRDFAVLLRSAKTVAPVYETVLSEFGIPVYSENSRGFLTTADVQAIVSFLRVIDNPLQDVPLLAVLMSPIFGFCADDAAQIRIGDPSASLYQALLRSEASGNPKSAAFCRVLRDYRRLSVSMPAGELVRRIYEDTAFPGIAGAMPNGAQRTANLELLLRYADRYDAADSYGISGFIRYLDRLSEHNLDPASASTLSPDADVVHIMTVHKSKGLEFPICILADTSHLFNKDNLRKNLILHPSLGIGLKGRDLDTGNTYPTLIHTSVKLETERNELSESMRVLYVAMTRAQNRLVLTGSESGLDKKLEKLASWLGTDTPVPPFAVHSCNSFFDWILLAMLRHPSAGALRERTPLPVSVLPAEFRMKLVMESSHPEEEHTEAALPAVPEPDRALSDNLRMRIQYRYPYAPLSLTVAKRAASSAGDTPTGEDVFREQYFAAARPDFLSQKGMTASERGTCLHKYMQYADFTAAAADPAAERDRLVSGNYLTETEASVIPMEPVSAFFRSPLAGRIFRSPQVLREQKFAVLLPAGRFDPSLPPLLADEKVLVQGIVDCAFREQDHLILLDYKTDRVSSDEELSERYREQILIYARALTVCFHLPVSEAYLYSFRLGHEISIPLEPECGTDLPQ